MEADSALSTAPAIHVVLVAPEIHWNTGNAGRSCVAARACLHLVEPLGFSLDEREVRRAGVHHWAKVAPRLWPSFAAFETGLPALGEPLLFSARGGRALWDMPIPERPVLIFGCESRGLDRVIRERYPRRLVRIPLDAEDDISLNLSTAVGIALYEVLRRRVSCR